MAKIQTLLTCMLMVALVAVSPLRAQFHVHGAAGGTDHVLAGDTAQHHGHSHDDDEPEQRGDKAHNPSDHSHETAIAGMAIPDLPTPEFRKVTLPVANEGADPPAFRHYRPPRLS